MLSRVRELSSVAFAATLVALAVACTGGSDRGREARAGGGGVPDAATAVAETLCASLAPLASGVCTVQLGDGDGTLIVGTLLTPGRTYRGGQVLIGPTGTIACVGCDCEAAAAGATRVECPRGVVSPGLINTHDHLAFSHNRPASDTGERYEHRHDWRKGLRGHTPITVPLFTKTDELHWGELRFILGGATSSATAGAATGLLRNLDGRAQDNLDGSVQEGLTEMPVAHDTFPLGDEDGTQRATGCDYGVARVTPGDIAAADAFLAHVSEGIDAEARNEFTCLGPSDSAHDILLSKSAYIHGLPLGPEDYRQMASRGTTLIWSPRSNVRLYGDTVTLPLAVRAGVKMALGTDWVATGSMNLLRELKCADFLNRSRFDSVLSDEALWLMVTEQAAAATARSEVLGTLADGKVADIAVFNGSEHADHRAVIDAGAEDVVLVMRGGKTLYGDAELIAALSSSPCERLDVCGTDKAVCLETEIGKSFAALAESVGAAYEAFFCETPLDEPSCVPARAVSVNGSSTYDGTTSDADPDGDGVPNPQDNCPTVFNPIRPVDNGRQADFDANGVGDACDANGYSERAL